jgi:hypothetical protein
LPDPTIAEVMDALAEQIQTGLDPAVETLQVTPRMTFNPTPPSIDIYPSDPFQERLAFGLGEVEVFFDVRARVSTAEHEGGQDLLLSLMDPAALTSVAAAISADRTLGGAVQDAQAESPSNFGAYVDPGPNSTALLGCTWRTRVIL